jgi:branched-chain amino acid transport system permease protein
LGLTVYLPMMAGQLSLATPGFYAIGGYVAAILSTKVWIPAEGEVYPWGAVLAEMAIAGVLCGALAVVVGYLSLRLRGIYLALATIAFIQIVQEAALNIEITGKAIGIFDIPQPFVGSDTLNYGVVVLPLLLFAIFFMWRLERGRVGRAFVALREDELASAAMGINPTYYKVLAFVMGAVLAGVVGAVNAHVLNTWNARQGTFDASILFLAFVIIGGSRTFVGAIVGGMLLTWLPELLRTLAGIDGLSPAIASLIRDGRFIVYGLLIAVGTQFFPQGIITPSLFKWRKAKEVAND